MEKKPKFEMIPLDRIQISASNVRADEFFGEEEDLELIKNIESLGILQPIVVRPVGDRYEVDIGRRRFLSAKEIGLEEIPCIVRESSNDESLDASLSENIHRKNVDPVTIGRMMKEKIERTGIRQTDYAKRLGISKSRMSEFLRMTELSPDMQNEVKAGTVGIKDALKVARMELPLETQVTLAMEARDGGTDSFKATLDRIAAEQEKRGAPRGLQIVRINWGKRSTEYNSLKRFAKADDMSISDYCQKILKEHILSRKG